MKICFLILLCLVSCLYSQFCHNTWIHFSHHNYLALGYNSKNVLGISSDIKDRFCGDFNIIFEQEGYLFTRQNLGLKFWYIELDAGMVYFHGTFFKDMNLFLPGGRFYIGNRKNLGFYVQYYGCDEVKTLDTEIILGSKKKQLILGIGTPLHSMVNNYYVSEYDFEQFFHQMKSSRYIGINYVTKYFDVIATWGDYNYTIRLNLADKSSNSRTFEDWYYVFDLGFNRIRFHPRFELGITISLPVYRENQFLHDDNDDYTSHPDLVPDDKKEKGYIIRSIIKINLIK